MRHVPISFEQFHTSLAEGAGAYVADVFTAIARETLDGRNAAVSDGVERALGRPARDFRDYAHAAAARGAWDPTPSEADITMTYAIRDAAEVLGIVIHDHLIIGKASELSFRSEGYL